MPFIVATYVHASSQGQRTHSARTNIGPCPADIGDPVDMEENYTDATVKFYNVIETFYHGGRRNPYIYYCVSYNICWVMDS